jgi:aspartyl-tRNA synthetase
MQACKASDGDLLLFASGSFDLVSKTLDKVRQFVAEKLGEVPAGKHNVLWVTDFPMFGWNADEKRLEVSAHSVLSSAGCLCARAQRIGAYWRTRARSP